MTKFKGIPLFGPDSTPQNTSEKLGLIGTGVLWLILFICFAVIKPAKKDPQYKEVQIVLSSTPSKKVMEEEPAPAAPAPAPSAAETVAQEVVEAAAPVVESKAAPKPVEKKAESKPAAKTVEKTKTKPAPAAKPVPKSEPVEYAKSVEDLMAEQFAAKKTAKTAEDVFAQMDDEEDFEETSTPQKVINNTTPDFSGSAATATKASKEPVKSAAAEKNNNQTASKGTTNALGKISNAKYFGTASSDVDTETTVQTTASGNGKVSMVMANGSSRVLLEPAKPVINLSEQAAATIDGSRKVSITFTVTESGNVPRGDIQITPESYLTDIVKKEIRDQISQWRFEAADYVSKATFEYKIVKYN